MFEPLTDVGAGADAKKLQTPDFLTGSVIKLDAFQKKQL